MTWARFDDRYDDNRKIKRAWRSHPRAVGLHAMSVTYSARHETDGLVDLDWLSDKLPKPAELRAVVQVLVDCGLFEPVDGEFFRVHDYTDFNPSRDELERKRARDAARKRKDTPDGIHSESTRNPNGVHADSTRSPNGGAQDSSWTPRDPHARPQASPAALPVPSRPTKD